MNCENNCCNFIIEPYKINENEQFQNSNIVKKKAGVLVYNDDKILIVQSRGNYWGFPKGTLEPNEKVRQCALRELKEETGIELQDSDLDQCICVQNTALYYIYKIDKEMGSIQHIENNDVNGIAWIKLECLKNMFEKNNIKLNYHCKYLIQQFFNIKLNK